MKPNFALSLSFDGLRLMHRVTGGWHLVGQVALDSDDLTGALDNLRAAADELEPGGISTKLLIPNDQIKYLALDTTRAEDADVREALEGATPYAVDDLVYDFAKGGGRTYVAAVAKDTLSEAQAFAGEHGFNPVSFAAVPEPFTYVGEAFFGAVAGQDIDRDEESVVVIGDATVTIAPMAAASATIPEATLPEPIEDADLAGDADTVDSAPDNVDEAIEAEAVDIETAQPDADAEQPTPEDEIAPIEGTSDDADAAGDVVDDAPLDVVEDAAIDGAQDEGAAPMFASRLRADRDEGRPAPAPTPEPTERSEPTFSSRANPSLAVPTESGGDGVPALSAPSRGAQGDVAATPPRLTIDLPQAEAAPAVTGDAPTALSPDAAVAAASLAVEPDETNDDIQDEPDDKKGAAATALGAASAVGGAVGGMFASRRMARAEAKSKAGQDGESTDGTGEQKSRKTVFGARKPPKTAQKAVVGGKPRFLGLILTAVLLLFLLAIAAFAALSEDGLAAWFGFGGEDTQVAAAPDVGTDASPTLSTAAPEVAALPQSDAPDPAEVEVDAPDALATPTAPTGGQVLTPEEAARIYAATGVWQRAPRIPLTPRTTSLDALTFGATTTPVVRVPASPLASASSVAGDALIATPIDPPPPSQTFDFDADGLVVATPQGAVTPDGILVIVGRPALNPPTRPGTVAPEITPQDQLAAVVPEEATTVTDAPEGVIVIAGRPVIEPPVRTGTAAPAPAPETQALSSGDAPLFANDGLLVLAGSPPILPPVRPGTLAPSAVAPTVEPVTPALPELDTGEDLGVGLGSTLAAVDVTPELPLEGTPQTAPAEPSETPLAGLIEGLNVIAGSPPVLPPARPGTVAPQAALDSLTADVASALTLQTAQTPTADVTRPLLRPAEIVQAAVAVANTPVLGALTASEAAGFRPRTRPAGLAPITPEPEADPAPEEAAVEPATPAGLQIAPEIAAAVQAAANRPNPLVNPTAQAVPQSSRPDTRPRNMDRIVARAEQAAAQAAQRAATQAATVAPRAVAPSGPTGGSVAQVATLENAINLRDVNLIGIYGGSGDRRALVRMSNGRYVRVTVGDRLDGGRVTAISASALSYTKRGRAITLEVPS